MNIFVQNILMAMAAFFILVLCTIAPCTGTEPIRLGVAVVQTGELASYGLSGLRGVELAVEDINARGGVLGRQIRLVVEDDFCLPKQALIVASKLLAKKVHAVIGHTCSGATFAALQIYREAGILTISPSATNPDLTQSGDYPNFFRTIASDDTQALVQIELAVNRLGLRRLAIVHDKTVYGKGLAEYIKEILKKTDKRKIALYEGISTGNINATQIVQKIRKTNADAVIYCGYHPGASKIVRQLHLMRMDTTFIAGDGIKDDSFIAFSKEAAEGVYATAPQDTSGIKMAVQATKRYNDKYDEEPGPFFLNGYAAVLVLTNAIETAGSLDLETLSKALRSKTVETPIGRIVFDERGDAVGTGFSIFQVRNGKFVW